MAHGAIKEVSTGSKDGITYPDFESYPVNYGWPLENERGYRIAEQLCGYERAYTNVKRAVRMLSQPNVR